MIKKGVKKIDINKLKELDSRYIKWLSEVDKTSGSIVGGKGANLAEMYNAGFPVPPAFCITAQAFDIFLRSAELKEKIKEIIDKTNVDNTEELEINAKKIRELIINSEIPKDMEKEIYDSYLMLGSGEDKNIELEDKSKNNLVFVAVRSSATTEDLAGASFAGQQETYTNIKGEKPLFNAVKHCFASLYTARAVYYRHKKGFDKANALLSVVVQKMINSEKSGVMFTKNPTTGKNEIIIEAVFGLGEGIVSGKILPDHYVLNSDLELKEKVIANKKIKLVKEENGNGIEVKLKEEESRKQVLLPIEISSLGSLGEKIEKHYNKPQDIEFAIENHRVYIVQSRPITTIGREKKENKEENFAGNVLLLGLAASPGMASGKVKLIKEMKDLKEVTRGHVLVTKMTNPDMVVAMQKASAIITGQLKNNQGFIV